jgi:hypothetical protein
LLAGAAARCDMFEVAPPAAKDPSASKATRSAEPISRASSGTGAPGESSGATEHQATDEAPQLGGPSVPHSAPPYLPATYRASLSCPRQRLPHTTAPQAVVPQFEEDPDPSGTLGTYQPGGPTTTAENAFFRPLGTNARACVTCHEPANGMSVSVERIQLRFERTRGADPIFAPVDGADCPNAVGHGETAPAPLGGRRGRGTREARASHSLLLTRGLFRIFLPVPSDAEYAVTVERDPYHCNTDPNYNRAADPKTGDVRQVLSVYRRPRPATNLKFVSVAASSVDPVAGDAAAGGSNIMWDGREPSLGSQAVDATLVHAQALASPTDDQLSQIVAFQRGIFSAQVFSQSAHALNELGGLGGPEFLAALAPASDAGAGGRALGLFDAWLNLAPDADRRSERESVLRGQTIFESRTFAISNVAGLTDSPGLDHPISNGSCATCHNQPGVGTS